MYNHHEKGRGPNLESVLADFMTYQANSKGNCYSTPQQRNQFGKDYSFEHYQWESKDKPCYQNEAEGLSYLDDLLMQFKGTVDPMQQAFKRAETQIGKLVDDMTKVVVRREEEYAEIETHQESILQVNTIHHQLINKEEKNKVSFILEYSCMAMLQAKIKVDQNLVQRIKKSPLTSLQQ